MVTTTTTWNRLGRPLAAALAVALACLGATPATAAPVPGPYLNFSLNPLSTNAKVNYAGGSAPLVGSMIDVSSLKGLETSQNLNGTLPLQGGELTFQTGGNNGYNSASNTWSFGSGGKIAVTGGIPSLGIAPGTTLLEGSFSDLTFVRSLGGTSLKTQGGALVNVVNSKLAQYYGLPTGGTAYLGGLTAMFAATESSNGAFASTAFSGGSIATQPVPEPAALVVFAALAAGGAAYARRRRINQD